MDEKDAPYLFRSGLKLDFEILKTATEFSSEVRLDEEKKFLNGMMRELVKNLGDVLSNDMFFLLVQSIVPMSVLNDDMFPKDRQSFVGTKLNPFKKKVKAIQKTKEKLISFLDEEFVFFINRAESPRKRVLKRKITELTHEKVDLVSTNKEVIDKLETLENDLTGKNEEIDSLETRLAILKNDKVSLQQRIKGLKSANARKSDRIVKLSTVAATNTAESETMTKRKGTSTNIEGIQSSDIIVINQQIEHSVFKGKRYFGHHETQKKGTTGHTNIYFEVPEQNKICSEINKKEIQRRAKFIDDVSSAVAGSSSVEQRQLLYTELIKQNKEFFKQPVKNAGFDLMEKLTPEQTINMQTLLRLPTNKVRNLRTCLSNFNVNVLPSERKIRKAKTPLVSHVEKAKVESGFMGLKKTKNDDDVTLCAFVRVKVLRTYIEEIITRDTGGFSDNENFNNKWWLMFAGDKGGNHMKYHVEVINSLKSGSVDNVHIYCMFEATDSVENMRKVWLPYHRQVKQIQEDGFMICSKEVVVFLGGDYHFLDDNMGHQGSSATYPSSTDKVLLTHLQHHADVAHTPQNCPTEMRTVGDYHENYSENLGDNRNRNDLRENGKYHNSVAGPMIFPLKCLKNLVPASMHINLGVVLLLYNLLLKKCKDLDAEEGGDAMASERAKLEEDWELSSLALQETEHKLQEHGQNVVIMINRMNRYVAVIKGDERENIRLSDVSDTRRKSKKSKEKVKKCRSPNCFVTKHDINVQWVACDTCDEWYHTMCETLTPLEEITTVNEDEIYKCIECSHDAPPQDRKELFSIKIASLIDEEDMFNERVIEDKIKCDNFQATYRSIVGSREKRLNDALESIKVVRQAYHGNVMVGNHCVIVLKKYYVLTSVIDDQIVVREHFDKTFSLLASIMNLVMTRRFLTESECTDLEEKCTHFGDIFPIFFPDRKITRKIHELIFNIPRFVKNWKTIGMLSEQEGESKHAAVNAELRSLACVRNHAEKIRLVIEKEELRAITDKSAMIF